VLGWVSREHLRHYIDLAYVARDFDDTDRAKTCELIAAKFSKEKASRLYRDKGIATIADLVSAFSSTMALKALRNGWERTLRTEIFFMPLEHTLSPDQTLIDVANVERYAGEFWMPPLEQLAATPR
jgi:hypothetical protein